MIMQAIIKEREKLGIISKELAQLLLNARFQIIKYVLRNPLQSFSL